MNKNKKFLNKKRTMNKIMKMSQKRKKITKKQPLKSLPNQQLSHQKNQQQKRPNLQHLRHLLKLSRSKNQLNKTINKLKMKRKRTSFLGNFIFKFLVKNIQHLMNKTDLAHFIQAYFPKIPNHKWPKDTVLKMVYLTKTKQ